MYSSLLTAYPDRPTADKIDKVLLENRLIACVNLLGTESDYWWQGSLEHASEILAVMKIRTADFDLVKRTILEMHPYEVPCIVRYDIAEGHDAYLKWVEETTARPPGD